MATFGSLFAGIGGIDLGLERAGWDCRFQVEWDPFCQRVLAKHWPDVPRYGDIHEVHGRDACDVADTERGQLGIIDGPSRRTGAVPRDGGEEVGWCDRCLPPVDLLAGGFPCQPFSVAGKRGGMEDDRWLWPEFARAIRELRPRFVLVENVPGLLVGGGMGAVLGDLAELGYDAEWESIPAAAVGAPHLRYRVWIIGYLADADEQRRSQPSGPREPVGTELGLVAGGRQAGDAADAAGVERERLSGNERLRSGREVQEWASARRGEVLADPTGRRQPGPGQPVDAVDPAATADREAAQPLDGGLAGQWLVEPDVGRVAHGVPARVDRLRSLGNAVVPQVVEVIGRRMLEALA